MAEFSGVPHTGHVFHMRPVLAEKTHELRSGLVGKSEDDPMINLLFDGVAGDPPENGKARGAQLVDR